MSFDSLGLKPELLRAVADKGYTQPTPIQAQAIPAVLSGSDVLAGAQTGTGKTAGFTLPLLQKLGARSGRNPRALVLTPTRELAAQVAQSIADYGKYGDLRTQVIFGGVSERPQIANMRNGCDILVATPGRLLDLCEQRAVNLSEVQIFILDEADRMLDMGFIRDIKRILKMLPQQRQNLMFSATYSDEIRQLANSFVKNPISVQVTPRNATADKVEQSAYRVSKEHKRHLLAHLIKEGDWHQVLVFTRTKHGANRLTQQLERAGITAMAIHGNKSQNARVRALEDFKENRITALVATEVAARGLDIKELPHVVNYELPNVPEDYVHRIGRTARAGSTGAAVSLVSPDELSLLKDIEKMLKRQVEFAPTPKFEITEGTHTPRAGSTEAGEYQPHQDPRRRPEHRRSGGGGGGRHGGRGGQSGGRAHAPRAAGQASHEDYSADFGASSPTAPGNDTQGAEHGSSQGHPGGSRPGNRGQNGGGGRRGRGGGQRGQQGGHDNRGGQRTQQGGQGHQGQGQRDGQGNGQGGNQRSGHGENRGGGHQGRGRDGQRRGGGGSGQRGRGGFARGARSSGGSSGGNNGGGFSRIT
ncbi:MAG: ATP-dependent helicase RhlE [Steroidobacteraceae bacterium]|jgi:ATP-dependent RNA helicase RhlE|nr:ATP-dependent helicase RhlE [Steroidobacteraceae bacterium]